MLRPGLRHRSAPPIDTGLLAQAVSRIVESGVTTAVQVPSQPRELTPTFAQGRRPDCSWCGTIISAERVVVAGGGNR